MSDEANIMQSAAGAVPVIGSIFGAVVGAMESATSQEDAENKMREIATAYNVPLPALQQMVAEQLGPSKQQDVYADPNAIAAQTGALGALQDISDSGGMTLEDKVNNNMLQRDAAQRAMAQRQSIVNVLRRGGQAPGAVSAALQLGAARDQQETGALAAAKTGADARRRAIEATLERGRLGGQMRQQGFSEGSTRARAADQIAAYNAQAKERAQRYNLGLPQQNFENYMQRAAGQVGANTTAANFSNNNAARIRGSASDFGTAIGTAGMGIAQALGGGAGAGGATADPYGPGTAGPYSQAPVPMQEKRKRDEDEDLY